MALPKLQVGDVATVSGLQNPRYQTWNGQQVIIRSFVVQSQRFEVSLVSDESQRALLKQNNLKFVTIHASNFHTSISSSASVLLDQNTAITYNNRGYQLLQQGQYVEAVKKLHSALALKRRIFDKDDTRIAITALLLADTYLAMKQFDKATEYCQETITIRLKANDPELKFAYECMDDIKSAMQAAENQNSSHACAWNRVKSAMQSARRPSCRAARGCP